MIRRLLMVVVWLGIGYFVGFADARQHERTIVSRTADRFRGIARDTYDRQKQVLRDAADEMIEAAAEEVIRGPADRRSPGQEDSVTVRTAEGRDAGPDEGRANPSGTKRPAPESAVEGTDRRGG